MQIQPLFQPSVPGTAGPVDSNGARSGVRTIAGIVGLLLTGLTLAGAGSPPPAVPEPADTGLPAFVTTPHLRPGVAPGGTAVPLPAVPVPAEPAGITTEPGEPADPGGPGAPGTPTEPGEPGGPGRPGDPTQPGEPGHPGGPGGPEPTKPEPTKPELTKPEPTKPGPSMAKRAPRPPAETTPRPDAELTPRRNAAPDQPLGGPAGDQAGEQAGEQAPPADARPFGGAEVPAEPEPTPSATPRPTDAQPAGAEAAPGRGSSGVRLLDQNGYGSDFTRSLIYSGVLALLLATIGIAMVTWRRRQW